MRWLVFLSLDLFRRLAPPAAALASDDEKIELLQQFSLSLAHLLFVWVWGKETVVVTTRGKEMMLERTDK